MKKTFRAVVEVLRSDWLTTGPKVEEFERIICRYTNVSYGVAVSSGTAGLHAAIFALNLGPGDEVILPPMTFAATANCVLFQGAVPVFADVLPDTLLIDPLQVEAKITTKTKAIAAVDFTGHPADYDALQAICRKYGLYLIADACHSLGAEYKSRKVGTLADMSVFSFHPVKHISTGEGGMVVTDNPDLAERLRIFRNHGITSEVRQREKQGAWFYELVELGYNYRLSDIHCALGISQMKRLPVFLERRREIARQYDLAFSQSLAVAPLKCEPEVNHAYHLYVVRIKSPQDRNLKRNEFLSKMRDQGVMVNVHYIPVHLHPLYRHKLGLQLGICPVAEAAYEEIISLPIFPDLKLEEIEKVVNTIRKILVQ